jgi:macrolide-specific efflux system membrane fusion protein
VGIAALLLILALGLWAYVNTRPETANVERRDLVVSLPLAGTVVAPPTDRADILAPYRAPVARVYASVGDRVSRGDVLVELSFPSAQAAYDQARQAVKAAEAASAGAQRQYGLAVKEAENRLAAAQAAEREARASAAAVAPSPEASVTVIEQEPAAALAAATQARIEAEQALLQARSQRDAALAPYRQRLQAAQEAFREAQTGRKQAMIRSPIAGTVLALNTRPGEEVGKDTRTPVAVVVDLSELQVHAPMKSEEASDVHTGATVTLTAQEVPGQQFEGTVARITTDPPRPLGGSTHVAIIEFKNDEGLLKPEMKVSAQIRLGQARNVLTVPAEAVGHDSSGRPVVEVLRGGRWQEVVVDVGLSDGRYAAIRSGLKEGETVKFKPRLL